jgi:hypothetical protein
VKSTRLHVKLADREEVLTDETFPLEFNLPLNPSDKLGSLHFEAINAKGELQQGVEANFGSIRNSVADNVSWCCSDRSKNATDH